MTSDDRDREYLWEEDLPTDPVLRRVILWRATAVLAATGRLTLEQILLSLVMDVMRPPTDDELVGIVRQAREAAQSRNAKNN